MFYLKVEAAEADRVTFIFLSALPLLWRDERHRISAEIINSLTCQPWTFIYDAVMRHTNIDFRFQDFRCIQTNNSSSAAWQAFLWIIKIINCSHTQYIIIDMYKYNIQSDVLDYQLFTKLVDVFLLRSLDEEGQTIGMFNVSSLLWFVVHILVWRADMKPTSSHLYPFHYSLVYEDNYASCPCGCIVKLQ